MLIKKYLVRNMNEGIAKIKKELGAEAIIISQRKVNKKGVLSFFSPKLIEITATTESKSIGLNEKIVSKSNREIALDNESNYKERIGEKSLKEEFKSMKDMLLDICENINREDNSNRNLDLYMQYIASLDISPEVSEDIIEELSKYEINGDIDKSIIRNILENKVSVKEDNKQGVKVFVGPTGVGKTTTIAKLAGKYVLQHKKKVGLITIDTYRIGAVEQLKIYAEIMNIPFKVVFTLNDMEDAMESMKDCEVILVDTTGRNSKNLMQIQELRAFVEKTGARDINLVLSSTTKSSDIGDIIKGYSSLQFNSLIFTKLDETSSYGALLDTAIKSKVPLSYVTLGQNVPEDIKILNKDELISIILGEKVLW
ncbi:flagellar biosynthesis protein FlhF [Hathewaya histolytica]|uniref:Flagellar biosynthesis protein FlhF n=1 Tax=Hathewaya histolytica TaxID=1498 RepID=A0A4U9RC22_HATHI|nr:flagellar biosynthesis protein FlhF [Hathewaya histolytica]VTQ87783.1 flagellar biosynthesis regulator FlhF [Hathewaya histolytica]